MAIERVFVDCQRVGQVDHVASLSLLEQGGVALGIDLLDLPLHGWQFHVVFTCIFIRLHFYAVAGGVRGGLVGVLSCALCT